MGSYKDVGNWLPFVTQDEWESEVNIANKLFRKLKGRGSNPGLRGVPFYLAFIHTGKGVKILENNSRPGDPEIQNLLPILKSDFIDVCLRMLGSWQLGVKVGKFSLDLRAKIGYFRFMVSSIVSFVLRISLIVVLWAFVWRYVEPRTQLMRILRAALLVLGLLAVLAVMRIMGQ